MARVTRDPESLANPRLWLAFASMPFVCFTTPPFFGYLATTQHALYFAERGFSAEEASLMLAVGGVLSVGGRMLSGVAADRLGAPTAGFLSSGLSLTGMLCLFGLELWPRRLLAYAYVLFIFLPLGSRATIVDGPVDVGRAVRPDGILPRDLSLGRGHRAPRARHPCCLRAHDARDQSIHRYPTLVTKLA